MAEKRHSPIGIVILVILLVYAGGLLALAIDQILGGRVIKPELDLMLIRQINSLGDPALSEQQREARARSVVGYHEFSVPLLLEAIEKGAPRVKEPALRCLQEIAQVHFGDDITPLGSDGAKLRDWWRATKAKLESAQKRRT